MLITVGEREFNELVREKEDIILSRMRYIGPISVAMAAQWYRVFDHGATVIFYYILGRTFGVGKGAERVSVSEFLGGGPSPHKGGTEIDFSGVGMSMTTFRKHIKRLCDDDILTVYSARTMLEGAENQPRMFEINCKKLLNVPTLELGRESFFLQVEADIAREKEEKSARNFLVAPTNTHRGE